jgi:hypothetical protein
MRTLVVGDVHGCVVELDELIRVTQPERVILVGDVFTKGPDAAGVLALIKGHAVEAVMGNHDQRLLDVLDGKRANDVAAQETVRQLGVGGQDWLRALPLYLDLEHFWVIHAGVHPIEGLKGTTKEMALNMRYWPQEVSSTKKWHEQYTGQRGVIFGHDARQGSFQRRRDDKPWLIGLDSGCVYGGALSGYLVEEDRIVQIPAKDCYQPI